MLTDWRTKNNHRSNTVIATMKKTQYLSYTIQPAVPSWTGCSNNPTVSSSSASPIKTSIHVSAFSAQWPYQQPKIEGSTCNSPLRHYQVGFSPATNLRPQQKSGEEAWPRKIWRHWLLLLLQGDSKAGTLAIKLVHTWSSLILLQSWNHDGS